MRVNRVNEIMLNYTTNFIGTGPLYEQNGGKSTVMFAGIYLKQSKPLKPKFRNIIGGGSNRC